MLNNVITLDQVEDPFEMISEVDIRDMKEDQGIDDILNERGARYGTFTGHAAITQGLKAVISASPNWATMDVDMRECVDMLAHKLGRILNGDPTYLDSWIDIVGYTQLVVDRLNGKVR